MKKPNKRRVTCSQCIPVINLQKPKSEGWEDRFKLHADTQEWFIRQSDFKEAKYFISRLLKEQKEEIVEEMLKNFGKGNYMDTKANMCDCRHCYIDGFNDCMRKLKEILKHLK